MNFGQREEGEMSEGMLHQFMNPSVEKSAGYAVDSHLTNGTILLDAIMDAAEVGRRDAEERGDAESNGRFIAIMELLTMYQAGNRAFVNKLYKKHMKAA